MLGYPGLYSKYQASQGYIARLCYFFFKTTLSLIETALSLWKEIDVCFSKYDYEL